MFGRRVSSSLRKSSRIRFTHSLSRQTNYKSNKFGWQVATLAVSAVVGNLFMLNESSSHAEEKQNNNNPSSFDWSTDPQWPSLAIEPHRVEIVVLGDSISLQYHSALEEGLDSSKVVLSRGKNANGDEDNTGVNGANGGDSFDILRSIHRLSAEVEAGTRKTPEVLLLNCGLHDLKRSAVSTSQDQSSNANSPAQVPLNVYSSNLNEIFQLCKTKFPKIRLFWVRTTPVDDAQHAQQSQSYRSNADVIAYNTAADQIATEAGVTLMDLTEISQSAALSNNPYKDHVHFTENVTRAQGLHIANKLRQTIAEIIPERSNGNLITPEQWAHFQEEGYVVLPPWQVFTKGPAEFKAIQSRLNDIMLGIADVPYDKMMMQLDSSTGRYEDIGAQTLGHKGSTTNYRKMQNLDLDPIFMKYLRKDIFQEVCDEIYGDVPISSFRTMFFNKPASTGKASGGTTLPWHQDRWLFLDIDPIINIYTAFDIASPQSGCMQIIPGSHKRGVINPTHHSGFLTPLQAKKECKDPIYCILHPGQVLLIHNWVLHKSGVNITKNPRRALSVSYMNAHAKLDQGLMDANTGGGLISSGYPEGGANFPLIFKARSDRL